MNSPEPPSRSYRPFVAVAFLAVFVFVAAGIILVTKKGGLTTGRSLSLIARLPTLNAKTRFSIDAVTVGRSTFVVTGVQPVINVSGAIPISVRGWAVDDKAKAPAKGVGVFVDGGQRISARYGIHRDDVAKTLQARNLADSGFSASVETRALSAGQHELTFEIVGADGHTIYRTPQRIQFVVQATSR
jgi:hypothetical protein